MFIQEALEELKNGKYKFACCEGNKFCFDSSGQWLTSDISNVEMLTSPDWTVEEEILPEGVFKNEEGQLLQNITLNVWLVISRYKNGPLLVDTFYTEDEAVRCQTMYDKNTSIWKVIDLFSISKDYVCEYRG